MKKSEKEALELKIKDIAHSTSFSNPWLEDNGLCTFLSQSQGFLPNLSSAFKAFALTMAPVSLLEPEALEPNSLI